MGEMADYALEQLLNQDELECKYSYFEEAVDGGVEELLYDEFGVRYPHVFTTQKPKPKGSGLCPKCGAKTVERQNSKTGDLFWGCSRFPVCKGSRNY